MSEKRKIRNGGTVARLLIVALLSCALLASSMVTRCLEPLRSSAATMPPLRRQQYRVVNFICAAKCSSTTGFVGWETTFVRDIIMELKFDSQNEYRIGRLPIEIFDSKQGCELKDGCDRITVDMGERQLILKCATKVMSPVGAKGCNVPPQKREICTKSMLATFATAVREHHQAVHGGN